MLYKALCIKRGQAQDEANPLTKEEYHFVCQRGCCAGRRQLERYERGRFHETGDLRRFGLFIAYDEGGSVSDHEVRLITTPALQEALLQWANQRTKKP